MGTYPVFTGYLLKLGIYLMVFTRYLRM